MAENKHTKSDLYQMQALPLSSKIRMTERRIYDWVDYYGENGVYVSFSGGKDSTVLMDIVRNRLELNIKAIFVDVPTQYPELKEFAQTWDNVEILKPKIGFMQVCEKYGFPLISKEISESVQEVKKALRNGKTADESLRIRQMFGMVNGMYDKSKYRYLLESPFEISHMCCYAMKKHPVKKFENETGRHGITGQMASESVSRTSQWIRNGCNGFELKRPVSNPMSFWTDQDVLQYIKEYNIPICSVYGNVVEDWDRFKGVEGQMTISDIQGFGNSTLFDADRPRLKTTGCKRTGCMLCGFGCHLERPGEGRFEMLKNTHPGMYKLLDVVKSNGYTMREAIEWINEHGNTNIQL